MLSRPSKYRFFTDFLKIYKHLKKAYTFLVQIIFDPDMYGAPFVVKNTFIQLSIKLY